MTEEQNLARALAPIVDRVCRDTCWVKRDGKLTHLKQPLSDVKLARHIAGPNAYGAAPIAPSTSTTRLALLDFDSHRGETLWPEMQACALEVLRAAEDAGLRGIPFRSSGGAGIHVFFLWDEPQDAYSVRAALRDVLADCLLSVGVGGVAAHEVELFPKQDSVAPDGRGSMFVLPLAGQSVPLDTLELEPLDRLAVLTIDWPMSGPVALRERPAAQLPAVLSEVSVELATLRAALAAIPNSGDAELDYDAWRNVVFALHDATCGSDEGLALAHEFSARSSKYDPTFLENRVWPYVRSEREGSTITARTILHMAREHGWAEDVSAHFDVVEVGQHPEQTEEDWPSLKRNKKGILPTADNACRALSCEAMTGWRIAYDSFKDEIVWTPRGKSEWRGIKDADVTSLRIVLEQRGFTRAPKELVRDAIDWVAQHNAFDSAQLWINGLAPHDGVSRCETFLIDYCGVEDTPYARAVSRYLWTALAGRVLAPGCQADMAIVLTGEQGLGKTTLVKALVPAEDFYVSIALDMRDADLSRRMRGRLVGEIAELRGIRSKEMQAIKDFISQTTEDWIPKFKEFATKFPRRLVFIGTTNEDEFLADSTGNRRWLPVRIEQRIDVAAVRRDVLQLWAEARELWRTHGVCWEDADRLARDEHQEFMVSDTWQEPIARWLDETDIDANEPRGHGKFTMLEVLTGALGMSTQQADRRAQMRAADTIKALGYIKVDGWLRGRKQKYWADPLI